MIQDFTGKTVLVTGGTMGIGLECALGFAKHGAKCVLTYKWGTADEDAVLARFAEIGALPPDIFRADAGNDEDTVSLMEHLRSITNRVDVFVSNVSAALVVGDLKDYSRKALFRSIEYSAWPMFGYTLQMFETFGKFPRYVIGMSSTGVDAYSRGYDFMAASKAVMETLCRYFDYRLRGSDVRINVIRGSNVRTLAFRDTFGKDFEEFASRFSREGTRPRSERCRGCRAGAGERTARRHQRPGDHRRPRHHLLRQRDANLRRARAVGFDQGLDTSNFSSRDGTRTTRKPHLCRWHSYFLVRTPATQGCWKKCCRATGANEELMERASDTLGRDLKAHFRADNPTHLRTQPRCADRGVSGQSHALAKPGASRRAGRVFGRPQPWASTTIWSTSARSNSKTHFVSLTARGEAYDLLPAE